MREDQFLTNTPKSREWLQFNEIREFKKYSGLDKTQWDRWTNLLSMNRIRSSVWRNEPDAHFKIARAAFDAITQNGKPADVQQLLSWTNELLTSQGLPAIEV